MFPSSVFQYCCLTFKHACYLFTSMDHGTAIQVRFRNRLGIRKYPARYSYRSCLVNRTFDGWHPASRKVPPAVYCFSILLLSHHARSISQHLCMFIFWTRVQDKASRKLWNIFLAVLVDHRKAIWLNCSLHLLPLYQLTHSTDVDIRSTRICMQLQGYRAFLSRAVISPAEYLTYRPLQTTNIRHTSL